ncbi:hypothetical protein [Streptomyces mirabilis]|uniref:hypothetical protein n=1 Tax=Streptomyces mirabilis TaxID=68239 RepID=UPI003686EEA8
MGQNTEASASTASSSRVGARFGMAQALVILGFATSAVVLRLVAHMTVHDTVVLLASSGGTAVGVLLAASIRHGDADRRLLRRLVNALMSGSGH